MDGISIIFLGGVLVLLCLQLVDLYMQLIEAEEQYGSNVPEMETMPPMPGRKGRVDLEKTKLEPREEAKK